MVYKIFYFCKRFFQTWELNNHNKFIREKIISAGGNIGSGGLFGRNVVLSGMAKVNIGNNVHIGTGSFIRGEGGLTIGDNTIISRNLLLYTVNHDYEGTLLPFDRNNIFRPVAIEKNVWIGMNVTICPGTKIGEGAIIGMGTIVYGSVPKFAMIGSNHWEIIKYRNTQHYNQLNDNKMFARVGGHPLNP
ncbi:acyltransferase [uncultured Desulfosarcina sp.]|uniref:acyltransferase n=1 Tax=uncultured Desulfosarcina sp. TaxID=218289 RepID=UPI0029C92B26|nr:acyltransferase [uncultured Desulfosarcina sp.]